MNLQENPEPEQNSINHPEVNQLLNEIAQELPLKTNSNPEYMNILMPTSIIKYIHDHYEKLLQIKKEEN